MDVSPQAILNEQIRQQELVLYLNSVLLDFDNVEEIRKLKEKLKRAKLLLSEKNE